MKYALAICAIVKNERDYLLEWIAYHRVVGVDHFLIYNNSGESDDGTTELLGKLQNIGAVEVVPWPDLRQWRCSQGVFGRPQIPAYYDGVARLRNQAEWVAFIDADEFIVPMREDDLQSTLSSYRQFGGVGPNWRMFGSSGALKKENAPVCKRFTMASFRNTFGNRHVKTIAKPELIRELNTHRPILENGIFVDEHGREITDRRGIHDSVSYDVIRINHYYTKSREEWLEKVSRGMADCFGKRPAGGFSRADHNHEQDTFILKFYDPTVEEMNALASAAGLKAYPSLSKRSSPGRRRRSLKSTQGLAANRDAAGTERILDVHLMGGFAEKMIQYLVARRISAEVEGCLISNAVLPEWGVNHPALPGGPASEVNVRESPPRLDIAKIVRLLSLGDRARVDFRSYALWLSNFPDVKLSRKIFPAKNREYPGYGPEYLVCNVGGGSSLHGESSHNVLLPIDFYADLARITGLKLVFMGQMVDDSYCRSLKRRFPHAVFHCCHEAMAEFHTFRNSRNLVPAVSVFSWLAAWLSRADSIILAVDGLFHPVQEPNVDLLPCSDKRYRFYLFPVNYAVAADEFEKAHGAIQNAWRPAEARVLSKLRTPRHTKRLQPFVRLFDEKFYLQTYKDIAAAVTRGAFKSGLDHYVSYGFAERRDAFGFDRRWYSIEYPQAALEVGRGEYADLMHHYVEIGASLGYKPVRQT